MRQDLDLAVMLDLITRMSAATCGMHGINQSWNATITSMLRNLIKVEIPRPHMSTRDVRVLRQNIGPGFLTQICILCFTFLLLPDLTCGNNMSEAILDLGREQKQSARETSTSVSIVDVRGECQRIELDGLCQYVLDVLEMENGEEDRLVWVPTEVELSNGTVLSLGMEYMQKLQETNENTQNLIASFLETECFLATFAGICLDYLVGCVEIDGRAYPRQSCVSTCEGLWNFCEGPFTFAAITASYQRVPLCGIFNDQWQYIETPTLTSLESDIVLPLDYVGLTRYQTGVYEVGEPPVEVTCRNDEVATNKLDPELYSILLECQMEISCDGPLNKSVDDMNCPTCGVVCPPAGTELSQALVNIQLYSALAALPFLVVLSIRGCMRRSNSLAEKILIICTFEGLIYSSLLVAFLSLGNTGCPSSGMLRSPYANYNTTDKKQFWSETPIQEISCAILRPSIHLLQSMYGAVATFVVVIFENVNRAIRFQPPVHGILDGFSGIVGIFLIIIIPLCGVAATSTLGEYLLEDHLDDRYQLDLVRYLYTCGPSYSTHYGDALASEAPFALYAVICIFFAVKLLRLCHQMSLSAEQHIQLKTIAELSKTLSRQVLLLTLGTLTFLVVTSIHNASFRALVNEYANQFNYYLICSIGSVLDGSACEPPDPLHVGPVFYLFATFSWNLLPLFVSLFLILSVAAKKLSARNLVKSVTTSLKSTVQSTRVAPAHSVQSKFVPETRND